LSEISWDEIRKWRIEVINGGINPYLGHSELTNRGNWCLEGELTL
jgi:hypothetical protein